MIEIEIAGVYKALFDIPLDSWSLDGYIASKTKAKEIDVVTMMKWNWGRQNHRPHPYLS